MWGVCGVLGEESRLEEIRHDDALFDSLEWKEANEGGRAFESRTILGGRCLIVHWHGADSTYVFTCTTCKDALSEGRVPENSYSPSQRPWPAAPPRHLMPLSFADQDVYRVT